MDIIESELNKVSTKFCDGIDRDRVKGDDPNWRHMTNPQNKNHGRSKYSPYMVDNNNTCIQIAKFTDVIIKEIRNNPTLREQIRIMVCESPKINELVLKGHGCKPIVPFQTKLRKLVTHLTHIVQDFGIFFPLNYRNIEHANTENSKKGYYSIEKLNQLVKSVESDRRFNDETLVRERRKTMIGWESGNTILFDKKGSLQSPPNRVFLRKVLTTFKTLCGDFKNPNIEKITNIGRKLDTVLKLRYIDNNVCNSPNPIPDSTEEKIYRQHKEVLEGMRNKFLIVLGMVNSKRRTNGLDEINFPTVFDPVIFHASL